MGTVRIATTCSQTFRPFSTNTMAPGYREILLRPAINCGIAEVECRVKTVLGTVECSYIAQEDGVAIHIAVPHGATATLVLPHETNRVLAPGTYDFLTH